MMNKNNKFIKRILTTVLSVALLLGMIAIPGKKVEAGGYFSADLFTWDRSKKGCQSFMASETEYTSNIFINAFMETSFPRDDKSDISDFSEWNFEGETYYFKFPEGIYDTGEISRLNNSDLTVTVQLMLRYDPAKARLVEPSARAYPGFKYYSPNMTEPAVIKEYRAYMDFLTEYFTKSQCHIDAWVCGNEVNAPDCWNFFGSDCMYQSGGGRWGINNTELLMEKYTRFYDLVFDAVKGKNKKGRVCICVDHCWTENDKGRIVPTKTFLSKFAEREGNDKDWCIAFHCYPGDLHQTKIWATPYNGKNDGAQFVDGYNLEVLTGFVKNNFGTNHRIMLTEQGFSSRQGDLNQAACLVYTFYKARFDDMIDVMHVMKFPGCGFELHDTAKEIWQKLDNGSDADEQWIFDTVKGTIGVNSWTEIVPNWKSQSTLLNEKNAYKATHPCEYQGVDYSLVFDFDYYVANNPIVVSYYTSDPVNNPPTFEQMFGYFARWGMDRGQKSSPNFDLDDYKANHPELVARFGDDNRAYYTYFCQYGREDLIRAFVERFYTIILDRPSEPEGSANWTLALVAGARGGADVADEFIHSQEYLGKGDSDEVYVTKMYRAFFNREPDAAGKAAWMQSLAEGKDRDFVLDGFLASEEYRNLCKSYGIKRESTRTFVKRFYTIILGRTNENITPGELDNWQLALDSHTAVGSEIAYQFIHSAEYEMNPTNDKEYLDKLYKAFFNRYMDDAGYILWSQELASGRSRDEILNEFLISIEFYNLCNEYGISPTR